jgi:hypothetical protein
VVKAALPKLLVYVKPRAVPGVQDVAPCCVKKVTTTAFPLWIIGAAPPALRGISVTAFGNFRRTFLAVITLRAGWIS